MRIASLFRPDYERYDGVRPINVYLLRLLFVLMVAFVATDAWNTILMHEGPWNHREAAAWCMWASYSLLAILGVFYPLKLIPIVAFDILYKLVWLAIVAYPLWRTNTLVGSPAEEMTYAFLWVVLPIVAMPWGYAFKRYVLNRAPEPPRGAPAPSMATA